MAVAETILPGQNTGMNLHLASLSGQQRHVQGYLVVGGEYPSANQCPAVQAVKHRYQHLCSGPAVQTLEEFVWQVDVRSVVLRVRNCLYVLLNAYNPSCC